MEPCRGRIPGSTGREGSGAGGAGSTGVCTGLVLASPKSSSFAYTTPVERLPSRVSMMLPGFTSPWMMPDRWASSRAEPIARCTRGPRRPAAFRGPGGPRGSCRRDTPSPGNQDRRRSRCRGACRCVDVSVRRPPGLRVHPVAGNRICRRPRRDDLDRHDPVEPCITCLVDLAHSPATDPR